MYAAGADSDQDEDVEEFFGNTTTNKNAHTPGGVGGFDNFTRAATMKRDDDGTQA